MIVEQLGVGKENAKSKKQLMSELHIDSERVLVKMIHEERERGAVFCSITANGGGYFIPATKAEAREFLDSMENRAKNTFAAIASTREFLDRFEGQEELDLNEEGDGDGGATDE